MLNPSSIEHHVLLACKHTASEPSMIPIIAPTAYLDWDLVLDAADQLGIAPLLYERLRHIPWVQQYPTPPETLKRWKNLFYWYQAENMKRFVQLHQILKKYDEERIPVIVLKGAALASLVYPRIGLRPMGDVDLLVKDLHLDRAENILEKFGFTAKEQEHTKEWYRQYHHHLAPYLSSDGVLEVELHHHIIPPDLPVTLPVDYLWASARPTHITDVPCLILDVEYLLIHLSLHATGGAFFGKLRTLYDIAEIIQNHAAELDWQKLLMIARTQGIQRIVYYTLWLAWDRVDAKVPPNVLQTLKGSIGHSKIQRRWVKRLLRRAIMIYDLTKQPWMVWFFRDTCAEWLSRQGRCRKACNISKRLIHRYRIFSERHHEIISARGGRRNSFDYPLYLIKKGIGLKSPLTK